MTERPPVEGTDPILVRCTDRSAPYRISGSDISLFLQSPFSLYCKHFVDRSEMDPPDASQRLFTRYGHRHETRLMRELYPSEAPPKRERAAKPARREMWSAKPARNARRRRRRKRRVSPEEHAARLDESRTRGFEKTLAAMREGASALLEPQLCFFPRGMHGSPDVLERQDGESLLGEHHYVVKEIKSSKKIKRKHVMQAAFYNVMLGEIQGRVPDSFYLLNAEGEDAEYEHEKYAESIEGTISGVAEIKGGAVPEVRYGRGVFPWSNYADKVAVEKDDLSLIPGISSRYRRMLEAGDIRTVAELLEAGESALTGLGMRARDAAGYAARAEAIKSGRPVLLGPAGDVPRGTEVFLRVEEALHGEVYMIGALVRSGDVRDHRHFVSAGPDGEADMLAGFLDMLGDLGDYAIYYWGSGEAVVSRLIAKHREGDPAVAMTDLQPLAARLVAFPTYRDQLRMIAEWMGFAWRDPDSDWGRGVSAYRIYARDGGRRDCLNYIIEYAEDNCAAVERVYDWLLEHRCVVRR